MKKSAPVKRRNVNSPRATRGAVAKPEPGKTKISIRLDNTVLEYFRAVVAKAGGGNYQTLINEALLEHVHRRSTVDVVRQMVREEIAPYVVKSGEARLKQFDAATKRQQRRQARRGAVATQTDRGWRRGDLYARGRTR